MNRRQTIAHRNRSFYQRWSIPILLLTLAVTPLAFFGAGKAVQSASNKVEDWLPKTFDETKQLAWFRKHFAEDQFIVISWEGCKLADPNDPNTRDDPRIERLANLLVPIDSAKNSDGNDGVNAAEPESVPPDLAVARSRYFKSVRTVRRYISEVNLTLEEAINRFQGVLIGPDGRQTCLVVTLSKEALSELKYVLGHGQFRLLQPSIPNGALRRLIEQAGIADEDLRMGGPPVDNVAIDEEGQRTLARLAGLSGFIGLFLAWWSLRSIILTMVVFASGVLSAAFSLAFIWVSGDQMDAIVMSMPALVYVLAISGAVHLINYYRDAVRTDGLSGAVERAVLHAYKPAFLCTITTATGLLSLLASDLMPIRKFGYYSATGVTILVLVVYIYLPAALQFVNYGAVWLRKDAKNRFQQPTTNSIVAPSFFERMWGRFGSWIVNHYGLVTAGCLLVIGAAAYGLKDMRSNIDLLKLFDSHARILQDYAWFEKNLGMLVPLEIVVRFPIDVQETEASRSDNFDYSRLSFLDRLETVRRMQLAIAKRFGPEGEGIVGESMSAATFAPRLSQSIGSTSDFFKRKTFNALLTSNKEKLAEAGFLRMEDDTELWRISLRVAAFKDVDYGQFVKQLKEVAEPVMDAHEVRVRIFHQLATVMDRDTFKGAKLYLWTPHSKHIEDQNAASSMDHEILMASLRSLLSQANLKTEPVPDFISLQSPMAQLANLATKDALVVLGDCSDADLVTIRSIVPRVIDGRIPRAIQASDSNVAAASVTKRNSLLAASMIPPVVSVDEQSKIDAVYTGVIPIVYKAQRSLLDSLVESTWWSFLTITPIMMLVARSFAAGAVAMLPNVLPVVVIFGGMGWLDIPIDIGSMMTASIALGVAVDDTIHFLARFRENLDECGDRNYSIIATYQHCAIPTLQAAVISGLGLSVFAFSTFTPTQRFGWLMLTILMAGVVSELILLPALLAGPLGRAFKPRRKHHETVEATMNTKKARVCAA